MKKEKLTHKLIAKIAAFIILGLCVPLSITCVIGAAIMWDNGFYTNSLDHILRDEFRNISLHEADRLVYAVGQKEQTTYQEPDVFYQFDDMNHNSNAAYLVKNDKNKELYKSKSYDEWSDTPWQYQTTFIFCNGPYPSIYTVDSIPSDMRENESIYLVSVRIDSTLRKADPYSETHHVFHFLYNQRYRVYVIGFAALLLSVLSFIFLMCAAGRRTGKEVPEKGVLSVIPFDLLSVMIGLICLFLLALTGNIFHTRLPEIIFSLCVAELGLFLFTAWCMQLAVCIKCGGWVQHTIIWRICHFLAKVLRTATRLFLTFLRNIPLVRKTVLILLFINATELFGQVIFLRDHDMRMLSWFFMHVVTGAAILIIAIQLRRLQKGSEMLASGNLTYQIPTERLLPSLKESAKNLNRISDGMQSAVSKQMKSERMKTELITNVSHDIKTPLTSIINYIGLLKETHTKEQEAEYIQVLDRQSQRLKKLTEDLVEASKASSGAMDLHIEKHSLNELLRQALGEYQERLDAVPLETILSIPEENIFANVDGRLMWRVLDNLLLNISKYALPHTRCYVELEDHDGQVCLRMKNISKERLNISPEELTDRFVRGDASRGGEGSGLGLHIAKSLTELMGGTFQITVDGDLFKAEILFPAP